MFEKLITNLKKSLPEALRKKMGWEDNSDDEQEFDEMESGSEESPEENSEEEKKKKMKSMIIKVIVILALGYFALDEFVLKDMQQQSEAEILAQAPKPRRKKVVETQVATEDTTNVVSPTDTDVSSETVTSADTDTSTTSPVVSDTPPIENINVLEKVEETAPIEPVEPVAKVEESVISEARVIEPNVDQKLDELVENVEETAATNPVEEIEIPSLGEKAVAPSMESKIFEGITETPPPAYDQVGRGLVYNCKDKFWACLDKPAYVTCNKNQKWNKSKGIALECSVADIYSSDEDCAKVQKFNVSTNVSTAFCQN